MIGSQHHRQNHITNLEWRFVEFCLRCIELSNKRSPSLCRVRWLCFAVSKNNIRTTLSQIVNTFWHVFPSSAMFFVKSAVIDPQQDQHFENPCTLRYIKWWCTIFRVYFSCHEVLGKKITKILDTLNTIHLGVLKSDELRFRQENLKFFSTSSWNITWRSTPITKMVWGVFVSHNVLYKSVSGFLLSKFHPSGARTFFQWGHEVRPLAGHKRVFNNKF